jgi:glucokinase
MPRELLLAGDVGGTKTALAVVAREGGPRAPVAAATYASAGFDDLASLVGAFLAETGLGVTGACFGVPGPVMNGRAQLTNLPWLVDAGALAAAFGWRSAFLLNDVQAAAAAVPDLTPDDLRTLQSGDAVPGGAIAVVAPGTGLGEAYLTWDGQRYRAWPTEGGHADFAPRTPDQVDLLRHLQARFGHVSYERVCCGLGLPNVYAFYRDGGRFTEPPWLTEALASAADPTPVIVGAALDEARPCPLCRATLETFIDVLAAEAGNLALKVVATGGVYLAGGIPPRILPVLTAPSFLATFRAKGRYAGLLARMPVHVVLNPTAALLGAACEVLART